MKLFLTSHSSKLAAITAAATMIISLSGCVMNKSTNDFPAGGYEVDVPVLWVGTNSDGTEVGGVESTQVWTSRSTTPGYTVNLDGIEAEGAGKAWLAASASAATVATLTSGTDPTNINIQFHIDSPIDGPSAGGILTVGLLASLRHVSLLPKSTMTGTISPDGSIGPIGGIISKVRAAADAGYTTVVIPAENSLARDPETEKQVDVVELGRSRGIDVIPVLHLTQAFETLTGKSLEEPLSEQIEQSNTSDLSNQRLNNISSLLSELKNSGGPLSEVVLTLVAETESALLSGDVNLASGLSREAYLSYSREASSKTAMENFSTQTVSEYQKDFTQEIEATLLRAQSAVTSTTSMVDLTDSQYASIPEALLGTITAEATLTSLLSSVQTITDSEQASRAAQILSDQKVAIDVFYPRDIALLSQVRGPIEISSENPIAFLSNYTNFLLKSGQANMSYLSDVLKTDDSLNSHTLNSFDTSFPIVSELLALSSDVTKDKQALSIELTEAAYALALYVNSSALVTDAQALGLFNSGIGETGDLSENVDATQASVDAALTSVRVTADYVDRRGWDPAYALAQASAGAAFAQNQLDEASSTNSVARGLNRLWAASVALQLMKAAPE